jgi:hypothetical protein
MVSPTSRVWGFAWLVLSVATLKAAYLVATAAPLPLPAYAMHAGAWSENFADEVCYLGGPL